MPTPRFQRADQLLRTLINRTVARSQLTDVSDASSAKHVLSAVSRIGDEFYFQLANVLDTYDTNSARGDDLDKRASQIMGIDNRRKRAAKAVGTLVFGRPTIGVAVNVQAGTVALNADGVEVVTTAATVIGSGSLVSAPVAAIARVAGAAGNIPFGSAVRFAAKPAGVTTVTNPTSFTGGRDKETDDEFLARIDDYVASLAKSTVRALEFAARSVELPSGQRVVLANAVEDPFRAGFTTLYVDDGTGNVETSAAVVGEVLITATGGEERVFTDFYPVKESAGFTFTSSTRGALNLGTDYVLDVTSGQFTTVVALAPGETITGSYSYFTGLLAEVQKVINGVKADRANYPGWRAAGTQVAVLSPGVLQQTVEAAIIVDEGYDYTTTMDAVRTALTSYINTLDIGSDLLRAELIAVVMGVDGVLNVTLYQPVFDVSILEDQIARITSGNLILL